MPVFTWNPDQAAKRKVKVRVNRSSFGDGYSQRTADGINGIVEGWDLTFSGRTRAEVDAIQDFLESCGGTTAFSFTTPRGYTKNFTASEWEANYTHDQDATISVSILQEYGA